MVKYVKFSLVFVSFKFSATCCIDRYSWPSVVSGVPQAFVIGPILFLIHINDLDLEVENVILKFSDDTKFYRVVINETEAKILQTDLNLLTKWMDHWQIKFNKARSYILEAVTSCTATK